MVQHFPNGSGNRRTIFRPSWWKQWPRCWSRADTHPRWLRILPRRCNQKSSMLTGSCIQRVPSWWVRPPTPDTKRMVWRNMRSLPHWIVRLAMFAENWTIRCMRLEKRSLALICLPSTHCAAVRLSRTMMILRPKDWPEWPGILRQERTMRFQQIWAGRSGKRSMLISRKRIRSGNSRHTDQFQEVKAHLWR